MFFDKAGNGLFLIISIVIAAVFIFAYRYPTLAEDHALNSSELAKLHAAAQKGDAIAQAKLGTAYLYGWGIAKNETEAVVWFRKAAEQGQPLAEYDMGEVYRNGLGGVAKNDSEAVKWYRRSAEQGNGFAQGNLAFAYHIGFGGLVKDDVQAYMWNSLAGTEGNSRAAEMRIELEKSMTPTKIAQAKYLAQQWIQHHSNLKHR